MFDKVRWYGRMVTSGTTSQGWSGAVIGKAWLDVIEQMSHPQLMDLLGRNASFLHDVGLDLREFEGFWHTRLLTSRQSAWSHGNRDDVTRSGPSRISSQLSPLLSSTLSCTLLLSATRATASMECEAGGLVRDAVPCQPFLPSVSDSVPP